MKEFNNDYYKRLQIKVDEPVDQWFITALEHVTSEPLFDYVDSNWDKQKWLLWEQWIIDAATVAKIENNINKWERWNKNVFLPSILTLRKYAKIWQWVDSLKTVQSSKVIDIIKTGKVKLYPMSDTDVTLLSNSLWLQLNTFANPNKAKQTMKALQSLLNKYKNRSWENKTIDDII